MDFTGEILVLSSDVESRRPLVKILEGQGSQPFCAGTILDAVNLLSKRAVALVFCERLPVRRHVPRFSARDPRREE